MGRRYTIKQLPPELRPRERLLMKRPVALSSAELLGMLSGIESREKIAVELASGEVISDNGDLFGLYSIPLDASPKIRNDLSSGFVRYWAMAPASCASSGRP
jgi:DNA repair protein RadC